MFGTWKYDPETDEVQNLRQAFDPITARSSQHQACNRCHEKKLKCSGEKEGCERCVSNHLTCEYTRSSSRGSRRGKKNKHRSTEGTIREDSPSSSSQAPPPSQRSYSSRLSPNQPPASLPRRAAMGPNGPTPADSSEESDRMLDRLDFSLLQPEDSFDLGALSDAGVHYAQALATGAIPTTLSSGGGYAMTAATANSPPFHNTPKQHHHHHHQQQANYHHAWHQQGFVQVPSSAAALGHPNMATAGQGYAVPASTLQYQQHHHHAAGYQSQLDPRYQWTHRGDGQEG